MVHVCKETYDFDSIRCQRTNYFGNNVILSCFA